MAWRGIVGKSFAPNEFEDYVGTLSFTAWRPQFVVVHNTGVPDRKIWNGWQTRNPPITDEQWGRNLEIFYRDQQGWSGCPHVFVTPAGILAMNPLTVRGTHSPSWNAISWGVETVGDFDRDPFTGTIKDNLVATLAILHGAIGLPLVPYQRGRSGLHFHKEDPRTTHRHCPGKNIAKASLIKAVQDEMQRRFGGEHPADEGGNIAVVQTAPGDPLNLRARPGTKGAIIAALPTGTQVTVLGGANVGKSRWLNVMVDGQTGWVAARFVDLAQPVPIGN